MRLVAVVAALLTLILLPYLASAQERPYLGVMLEEVDSLEPFGRGIDEHGVRFTDVLEGTPAEAGGLKAGDVAIACDTVDLTKAGAQSSLLEYLGGKGVGDEIKFAVLRDVKGTWEEKLLTVTLGRRPGAWGETFDPGVYSAIRPMDLACDDLLEAVRRRPGAKEADHDISGRLDALARDSDRARFALMNHLFRNPWELAGLSNAIGKRIVDAEDPSALLAVLRKIGNRPERKTDPGVWKDHEAEELLQRMALKLSSVENGLGNVFEGAWDDEVKSVHAGAAEFCNGMNRSLYLSQLAKGTGRPDVDLILRRGKKMDAGLLDLSQLELATFAEPELIDALRSAWLEHPGLVPAEEAEKYGAVGNLLFAGELHGQTVLVGGPGKNVYKQGAHLIIDIGGDDLYHAAAVSSPDRKCAVVIDLDGNDQYKDAVARGIAGNVLLLDVAGNDTYTDRDGGVAFAALGTATLIDLAGDDVYTIRSWGQAAALFGNAILLDVVGNDTYNASLYAQGVGASGGIAILKDASGDDTYSVNGWKPSSYGTKGVFRGHGQGHGLGLRNLKGQSHASGGIGVLVDASGQDRMDAGNFSQGAGYFYGLGILYCGGEENDEYIASRYGQGTAAHQAFGAMIDVGGDDTYDTVKTVTLSASWDQTGTAFVDLAGNDIYKSKEGGYWLSRSCHNGTSLFYDASGDDKYLAGGIPGTGGDNKYHGGLSLGLFLDGGGDDEYHVKKRFDNGAVQSDGTFGVRMDLDGIPEDPAPIAEQVKAAPAKPVKNTD